MEAFKKSIKMDRWGTVYAGLKRQWLSPQEVINYCEAGNIVCNSERLAELKLALDESLFEFFELIKKFVVQDGQPSIKWNEDRTREDFSVIPQQYWNFWEIEFLLRIVNAEEDKEKKLHQVAAIHSDFNFPVTWHSFLYYMPPPNDVPIGIDGLYNNLLTYIASFRENAS